jgi:hypothetical protein
MARPIRFACPACKTSRQATLQDLGKQALCEICGAPLQVTGPGPAAPGGAAEPLRAGSNRRTWLVCGLMTVAALWLITWMLHAFQKRQEARDVSAANRLVEAKVETARAYLKRGDWDEALVILHDALATEKATELEQAEVLWAKARQGQADALLESAKAAIQRKEAGRALQLLEAYQDHPQATEKDEAARLQEEVRLARADDKATAYLRHLTDAGLERFADEGRLAGDLPVRDDRVTEIFKDTLRRHLKAERDRRAVEVARARAKAERLARERAALEARVRDTDLFKGLTEFTTAARRTYGEEKKRLAREERSLELFFQATNVTDPEEKARRRAELRKGGTRKEPIEQVVARKRAQVKKDFRALAGFGRVDREAFEQAVDQELDRLLKELK